MDEGQLHAIIVSVLKSEMKMKKVKQKDLADKIGVSESTLIRNLKGESDWSVSTLLKLIVELGAENILHSFSDYIKNVQEPVEFLKFWEGSGQLFGVVVRGGKVVMASVEIKDNQATVYHPPSYKEQLKVYLIGIKLAINERYPIDKFVNSENAGIFKMHLSMAGSVGHIPKLSKKRIDELRVENEERE